MARKTTVTVPFRRRREGKTNYKKRLALLLSERPRIVVRKSLKNIQVQIIEYVPDGDQIKVGVSSRALEKFGYKSHRGNIPAAYLSGYLLGKKAVKSGIKSAVLDIGNHTSTKGNRIYAAVKGAIDAGLEVPCDPEMFPSDDRINGKHAKQEILVKDIIKRIDDQK